MTNPQNTNSDTTAANSGLPKLKKVCILGGDTEFNYKHMHNFREQILILGDGKKSIFNLDLNSLKGRTDENTLFIINAHGNYHSDGIYPGRHFIGNRNGIDTQYTDTFFEALSKATGGHPLNILLSSCYSGAAATAIGKLPENSVFISSSMKNTPSWSILCAYEGLLYAFFPHIQGENFVQNIVDNFYCFANRGCVISVKLKNSLFIHKISPFYPGQTEMYGHPKELTEHLSRERDKFIENYAMSTGKVVLISGDIFNSYKTQIYYDGIYLPEDACASNEFNAPKYNEYMNYSMNYRNKALKKPLSPPKNEKKSLSPPKNEKIELLKELLKFDDSWGISELPPNDLNCKYYSY